RRCRREEPFRLGVRSRGTKRAVYGAARARIPPAAIFKHTSDGPPGLPLPLHLATHLLAPLPAPALAQFATPTLPTVQLGAALTPGVGAQAGIALPAFVILTREATLYADYEPRFLDEDAGRLLVGLGVGGSVRVLRALTVVADFDAGPYDLD